MKFVLASLLVGIIALEIVTNFSNAAPSNENTTATGKVEGDEPCLVKTRLGELRGKVELSRNGKRYCSYLGVPYTNNPKRFEEAKPGSPWTGIRDATKAGPHCPQWQLYTTKYIGDENCLFVNMYYPLDDQCQKPLNIANESLPVLIHVHGGAYELGAGADFGPKFLMDECTVFLSMNYRLSALGFLTTNDGLIPGNLGLKDVVLALKWAQQNIDSFGGNPNLVTIMGISAGAAAVSNLIVAPSAQGLFHRVIAQSGSALIMNLVNKNPSKNALELAKRLNCSVDDTSTSAAIKECLLAASAKDLVEHQRVYKWNSDPFVPFGPVVENLNSTNPFQTVNPLFKLLSGDFSKVPLLMGFTENEGVLLQSLATISNPKSVSDLNTKWNEIAPINLYYDEDYIPQETKDEFSTKIRNFYFGNKSIGMETFQDLTNLHSDRYFVQSSMDSVELHSRQAPVYPYVFTYKEGFNFVGTLGYPQKVATHGSDTQFLLTYQLYLENGLKKGTPEFEFSEKMIKLWLSFAKTGVPSETWPTKNLMKPYKNDGINPYYWYKIDAEMSEIPNYLEDRRKFWRNLGLRQYDYPANY